MKKTSYIIKYAKERTEEVNAENFNEVYKIADRNRKEGEVIVSIRSR